MILRKINLAEVHFHSQDIGENSVVLGCSMVGRFSTCEWICKKSYYLVLRGDIEQK